MVPRLYNWIGLLTAFSHFGTLHSAFNTMRGSSQEAVLSYSSTSVSKVCGVVSSTIWSYPQVLEGNKYNGNSIHYFGSLLVLPDQKKKKNHKCKLILPPTHTLCVQKFVAHMCFRYFRKAFKLIFVFLFSTRISCSPC